VFWEMTELMWTKRRPNYDPFTDLGQNAHFPLLSIWPTFMAGSDLCQEMANFMAQKCHILSH